MYSLTGSHRSGIAILPLLAVVAFIGSAGFAISQSDWASDLTGEIMHAIFMSFANTAKAVLESFGVDLNDDKITQAVQAIRDSEGVFYYLNPWFPTSYAITLGLTFVTFLFVFVFIKMIVKFIPTIG